MKLLFCVSALLCTLFATTVESKGKHWALLVAGSNGWYNYRHQADVCHAYQIMHNNGIPDEQIIVMMYDDIAHSSSNPTPGIIINHPQGSDVYKNVPKDYTAEDVTPENFLSILQGNAPKKNGKAINSGPDDFIFVNLVDHGAPGIFAFPEGELHAGELINAINEMHANGKYKQMVIYVEACESGSLFKALLHKSVNVYATTASNGKESSYACYYDSKRRTYLGDLYSVNWMENSDKADVGVETLHKQYMIVKQETNLSHVQQFGDMSISDSPVDKFEGNDTPQNLHFRPMYKPLPQVPKTPVASEDVTVSILKQTGDRKELKRIMQEHKKIKCQMAKIVNIASKSNSDSALYLSQRSDLTAFNCYEPVARKYLSTCDKSYTGNDGYHLRQMYALVNMCEDNTPPDNILEAIHHVCHSHRQYYCH